MQHNHKKLKAFSLVELMVVLSIISIVVALAFPKYLIFKLQAARLEAPTNIRFIHTLQKSYHSENGNYGLLNWYGLLNSSCRELAPGTSSNTIGYRNSAGCKSRYAYYSRQNRDYLNGTTSTVYPDDHFSVLADSIDYKTSGLTRGTGLGINAGYCLYGRYRDMVVMNQDGETGIYRELQIGYKHTNYSAEVNCK